MTFSVEVTKTKPWFHREISSFYLTYKTPSLSIPLSSYFSDANGEVITMTATYSLGSNAPVTIPDPGGIFTKPTLYEIKVIPTSVS
jgi:hypothetical protein